MKLKSKNYIAHITKKYLKINGFFFIFNGINRNANDWIALTEQNLKDLNFSYYKNFNTIIKKILEKSTYKNIIPVIKGLTFFIKYNKKNFINKQIITNKFEKLFFISIAIKFNNSVYSITLLKFLYSFYYKKNNTLLYKLNLTNLKHYIKISK